MAVAVIDADAADRAARGLEFAHRIAITRRLFGAAWRVVARIEVQHQPFAAKFAARAHRAILVRQAEIRRHAAGLRQIAIGERRQPPQQQRDADHEGDQQPLNHEFPSGFGGSSVDFTLKCCRTPR